MVMVVEALPFVIVTDVEVLGNPLTWANTIELVVPAEGTVNSRGESREVTNLFSLAEYDPPLNTVYESVLETLLKYTPHASPSC